MPRLQVEGVDFSTDISTISGTLLNDVRWRVYINAAASAIFTSEFQYIYVADWRELLDATRVSADVTRFPLARRKYAVARILTKLGSLWMTMLTSNAPLTAATALVAAAFMQRVSRSIAR